MRRSTRVLLSGMCGVLVLTGCGGGAGGAGGSGDAVSIAVPTLPEAVDIDPTNTADGQTIGTIARSYSGTLFGYNGSETDPNTAETVLEPEPELATGATPSEDGLTWTVTLRPDVRSQWDNPLTAQDVAWSIDRVLATDAGAANLLALINVDTAAPTTVLADDRIEIHLTTPTVLFTKIFSAPSLGIQDRTAVTARAGAADPWGYEWLRTNSASFGPYQVGDVQLPNRVTLTANPHYWRPPGQVRTVTFVAVQEESTRLQSLLAGEVSYASQLSAASVPTLRPDQGVTPYLLTSSPTYLFMQFVLGSPKVQNPDVRRALSLAVDRQALVDGPLAGYGSPVTGCLPEVYGAPPTDLDVPPTASVDAARALLAGAGPVEPLIIGFSDTLPGGSTIPQILQENLARAGVTATLKPYTSYTTFLADMQAATFDIGVNGLGPYVVDPSYALNTFTSTAATNFGGYANPSFDDAVRTASTTAGGAGAAALATACQQFMQDVPAAPLTRIDGLAGMRSSISRTAGAGEHPLVYRMTLAS